MDAEIAANLIATLEMIADELRLHDTYLLILLVLVVPVFVDVMFRSGWLCWLDLKRRREDRARRRRPTIRRQASFMRREPPEPR